MGDPRMIDRFVDALSSLRLTLVGLACALILDFAGTLAQVRLGLYEVQSKFFHSFFVYWTPPGSQWHIPVLPGGWLIGLVLVANLLAGHVKRFQFSRRKAGILLVHAGLILLLLGQFVTECYQIESQMRLEIGETKNYAEDNRRNELAVIDVTNPEHDEVVAIPQALLEKQGEIRLPGKPFVLRVKKFLANSLPAGPMSGAGEKLKAQNGLGQRLLFTAAPTVSRMDDENSTTEPGNVVIAWCRRSRSEHWAIIRISSSTASTFAVPARNMACESARMILFMMFASSAVWL